MISIRLIPALLTTLCAIVYAQSALAQIYLRVDSGYSWSRDAGVKDRHIFPDDTNGIICGNTDLCTFFPTTGKLDNVGNTLILSGGVGYRFTPNFRTDLVISHRGGYKLSGTDAGQPTGFYHADIKSWAYLLNGYFDIPTSSPFKPYVGAGMGIARNTLRNFSQTVGASVVTVPDHQRNSRAWSLAAGVGYPISSSVTLDLAYRYTDLGKIETGSGVLQAGRSLICPLSIGIICTSNYSGASGRLTAHELTVGLRF